MPCPSSSTPTRTDDRPWSNYLQNELIVETYWTPASLPELVKIVIDAEMAGRELRAVGSGYSLADVAATTQWMVDCSRLNRTLSGVIDVGGSGNPLVPEWQARQNGRDPSPMRLCHVEAGITLFDLCNRLASEGLSPLTLGGSLGQTLAGATSTSTHGSEPAIGPFCDQIRAVHLVSKGGHEFWIEPSSRPITDNDVMLRRGLSACSDLRIIRDDDLFNSVISANGRFGLIYALVIEVTQAIRVAEWGAEMSTISAIRSLGTSADGFFSDLRERLPGPPTPLGISNIESFRYLDIIMNSRRPERCIVRRRWPTTLGTDMGLQGVNAACHPAAISAIAAAASSALAFFGTAVFGVPFIGPVKAGQATALSTELATLAALPGMTLGKVMATALNGLWSVQFEDWLEEPINLITDLVFNLEVEDTVGAGKVGALHHVAAGTANPASSIDCYRANSIEVIFDTSAPAWKSFVEFLIREAPRHRQSGYIAIRFTAASSALISMFQSSDARSLHCSIEVTSLLDLTGNDAWLRAVERRAVALGGRLHWGQQNSLTATEVQDQYPETLTRWRRQCARIVGAGRMFGNDYTRARGLEPDVPVAEDTENWIRIGHANKVTAMTAFNGRLYATTRHNLIWWREAALREASWRPFGHANEVVGLAALEGRFYAASRHNLLWYRELSHQDEIWIRIGHANSITSMTSASGRLYATSSHNLLWSREATTSELDWASIGHANGVVGLATAQNRLFALTENNVVATRDLELRETNWSNLEHVEEIGDARFVALAAIGDRLFAATTANELWTRTFSR